MKKIKNKWEPSNAEQWGSPTFLLVFIVIMIYFLIKWLIFLSFFIVNQF